MGGLSRYVSVMRLFDETRSEWTVPDIAAALGIPASTAYRTVRELVAEEFLEPVAHALYRLGVYFVEFDRLVRVTDPLYHIGSALLKDVAASAGLPCVVVLARLYANKVMCVADARSSDGGVLTSYERGRPRPLTKGATSKVVVAQLPARRLTKLLGEAKASGDFAAGPNGEIAFRHELAAIRKSGYSITRGEVDKGLVGIAAPVGAAELPLLGSLSLVVSAADLDDAVERGLVLLVVAAAGRLTEELIRKGGKSAPP